MSEAKHNPAAGCTMMLVYVAFFPAFHFQAIRNEEGQRNTVGLNPRSFDELKAGYGFFAAFWVGVWVLFLLFNPNDDRPSSRSSDVPAIDQRAYRELKNHGYSESDARNSAAGVRRLCEAGGGKDCS